jgi:hypothetical protein
MLTSCPASRLNQIPPDLGIPNRLSLMSSRSRPCVGSHEPSTLEPDHRVGDAEAVVAQVGCASVRRDAVEGATILGQRSGADVLLHGADPERTVGCKDTFVEPVARQFRFRQGKGPEWTIGAPTGDAPTQPNDEGPPYRVPRKLAAPASARCRAGPFLASSRCPPRKALDWPETRRGSLLRCPCSR